MHIFHIVSQSPPNICLIDRSIEVIKMLDSFEATDILETLLSSEEISKLIDGAISVNIYQMCIVNLTEEEVTAQVTTLLYFHIDYHYHSIV